MSVNKELLADMYLSRKMGISEISKETGIAKSMVRFYLLKQGVKLRTAKELMQMFNVSMNTIKKVKSYKTWRIKNVN